MTTRTLGFADLFLYAASMALSIRWISVAAATGPASLWIWVLAVVVFSGPLIVATAALTTRFDAEGGVYEWTAQTFGPFWGFLCGWLYWVCNLPFFSGVLVFMLNIAALASGAPGQYLLAHPPLFVAVAVLLSVAVGAAHYFGLGTGKWLSNIGGLSGFALIGGLVIVGALVAAKHGPATDFVHSSCAPPLNANGAILWATMVFGVGGTEALAFLRNDVRGGMKTILGVLAAVAVVQIVFYVSGTAAMLAILTPAGATRLSGLPDALIIGLKTLGLGDFAPGILFAAFLCLLGSYSAWFGVAARLPFAAGIDAVLPAAFGRRDPKSGAPVVSIAVQTLIVAAIVVVSQAGDTLKGAYDFLVAMSVLSYTLPFLFLFAVYLAVQFRPAPPETWAPPGGKRVALAIGAVGMAATVIAVACTLVPSPDAKDQLGEMLKLVFASAVLIFSGVILYAVARWRQTIRARSAS
jgi:amino acid transporter